MFTLTYTAAVLSIVCFGISFYILIHDHKNLLSRYFGLYVFSVAIFNGATAMADVSSTELNYRFWSGLVLSGALFFIAFFLCFANYFTTEKPLTRTQRILIFVPAIIMSCLGFTRLCVDKVFFPINMPAQNTMGALQFPILLYTFIGMSFAFIRLLAHIRSAAYQKKLQSIYITVGFLIVVTAAVTFSVILPIFGESRFFCAAPQFSIFMIALAGYAIFKHQLLDIKLIVQKSVIYTLTIVSVVGLYILLIGTIPLWIDISNTILHPIVTLLCVLISALSVPALVKLLKQKTDKIFFKDHVPYADAVHRLGSIMNLNLDLHTLINGTINELYDIFKPKEIQIYLIREKKLFARDGKPSITVVSDESFDLLPSNDDSLFVNAEYDGVNQAHILIGEKKSGDIYLPEDRQILTTFSYQFAMALQKTYLYEQLRHKNIELKNRLSENRQ
jgi:hypothetical protein